MEFKTQFEDALTEGNDVKSAVKKTLAIAKKIENLRYEIDDIYNDMMDKDTVGEWADGVESKLDDAIRDYVLDGIEVF